MLEEEGEGGRGGGGRGWGQEEEEKIVVSSLPLECFRAHVLGLRLVIHRDSSIHPTSKHLLSTTKCQTPLWASLGLKDRTKQTKYSFCGVGSYQSMGQCFDKCSVSVSFELALCGLHPQGPSLLLAGAISGPCLLLQQPQRPCSSWALDHPPLVILPTCLASLHLSFPDSPRELSDPLWEHWDTPRGSSPSHCPQEIHRGQV